MLGAFKTVRRGERRETFTAFAVLFLVVGSHTILETARDALFLGRLSADRLPLVYVGLAVVSLITAQLFARRGSGRRALAGALVLCAAITLLFWASVGRTGPWLLYALYIWPGLIAALVMLLFWTLLGDSLTITQAKRVYGAIGVGGAAGAIAGSGVASWLSGLVASRHLLIPAAVGFALAGLASLLLRSAPALPPTDEAGEAPPEGLARGASYVFAHPYARSIVMVAMLTAAAVTIADFLFKSAVATAVSPGELAGFFARAYLVFNGLSLVCQTLLAGVAVRRLGVPLAATLLPAILLATSLGALVLPLLVAVVLIKGADGSLRFSVHRTAFELLSVPLSPHTRALVKRLVDIAGFRVGQAVASLAILGLVALPESIRTISMVLIALATAWLVAALRLRRAYVELFRRRLSAGQVTHLRAFPELDAASLETVIGALDSDDDHEVIAAMEVLERDDKSHLVPKLLLFHPSAEVVRHVLALFARSRRVQAVRAIDRLLGQATPAPLRAAALAVRASLGADTGLLESRADDAEEVRAAAAVCRSALAGAARAPVDQLAASRSPTTRIAIAEAIAACECHALGDVLVELARTASEREVRAAAIAAMGRLGGDDLVRGLVELMGRVETSSEARDELVAMGDRALASLARALADADLGPVRRDLGDVIARADPERGARILVEQLEAEDDGLVRYRLIRALESIVAHHPAVEIDRRVIRHAITAAIAKAYRYLAYEFALERGVTGGAACATPGCRLLRRLLRDKRTHAVGRLFRLLGLAIPTESFAAAYRGITSDRPELRANAIELIDNVLPSDLRSAVLGLVDDLPLAERLARGAEHHAPDRVDHDDVLTRLRSGNASALSEAALYHARELAQGGVPRPGPRVEASRAE